MTASTDDEGSDAGRCTAPPDVHTSEAWQRCVISSHNLPNGTEAESKLQTLSRLLAKPAFDAVLRALADDYADNSEFGDNDSGVPAGDSRPKNNVTASPFHACDREERRRLAHTQSTYPRLVLADELAKIHSTQNGKLE